MALEELIVAWSKERPSWQQGVMCRVATGEAITDDDYERLVQDIVESKQYAVPQFGLQHLSQTMPEDLPVCILEIAKLEHVNALESNAPLTFEPLGLNIVYGDNGSGKSGYARLLKRITRARHQEEVLTDVFRDTSLAKPTAALAVQIGNSTVSIDWPEASRPELQRMLFYDAACGGAYTASESNFPYRPSALFVMDGLIEACVAIRTRIDVRLADNGARAIPLPAVPEQIKDTAAGRFLTTISGTSSVETLDALIATFDGATETIEQLKDQEASLRSTDTTKARQRHIRRSEKFAALRSHLEALGAALGDSALTSLQDSKGELKALEEAAALIACSFESEPLPGVGSPSWKALWEAAQRFSKEHAYAGRPFPFVADQCRCVLCQQVLDAHSQDRFVRFDEFVRNDTQVQLQSAERTYDQQVKVLRDLIVIPEVVSSNLQDLESASGEVVSEVRALLSRYEAARKQVLETLSNGGEIHQLNIDPGLTIARLATESDAATVAADELRSPEGIQKQLVALIDRRDGLELLGQIKKARPAIVSEIARLLEREALEAGKSAAATTGITKKILELSEESITEVVRDTFTRETERLRLERVTIARTRAEKGALLHQPKLVGARQQVTLPRVFSEGERTALGLAAFFTEAQLDSSRSTLILDDPVTSLDHIRRGRVAARLAVLAENRQVIIFTHDVAFVVDVHPILTHLAG